MQSQPGTNPALIPIAELMRFASSELLKIETALGSKAKRQRTIDALALGSRMQWWR